MTELELDFSPQLSSDARAMTVNNFYQASKGGGPSTLVLRPAFQRNLVWNPEQQSYLIDSILRGLPVPELYIQLTTAADGAERLVVVDGQQRISACLAFINGQLMLGNAKELNRLWRGKSFAELNDKLKAKFLGFKFIVRDLPETADDTVLREIFRRLNRTVEALEAQELRHAAYTGTFIGLVERGGAAESLSEVGVFTPKDYMRRRNDEFVAEVLMAVDAGAFPNKKEGLDELFLTFERRGVPEERLSTVTRRFGRALTVVGAASAHLKKTRFRNKSDCYSLLTLFARHADVLSVEEDVVTKLVHKLTAFSALVNEIKREEGKGHSVDVLVSQSGGSNAQAYLRAVERAASDRLSRVRRDDALEALLKAEFATFPSIQLSAADEKWPLAGQELEESEDDESEGSEEGLVARETLLNAD